MPKPVTKIATLVFEIALDANDAIVPTEAHLLPPGPFRSTDGRPEECEAWQLDVTIASQVISRMAAKKNDTLIDYEHQSLRSEWNGQPVIAAGWFHNMEWRDGKGLYAVDIDWTDDAKGYILQKKIRYISTVFFYYERTGEVIEVASVTMTNTPALDGLDSLDMAALSKRFNLPTETNDMQMAALTAERDGLKTQIATLTTERDSLNDKVAALTTERDVLKTRVDAFDQEQAAAALAKEQEDHAALLQSALTDGRLVPAQKAWAEKQSLADLTEYLDATAPLPITQKQSDGKSHATAALSKEQADMAAKMGVSAEDYLAAQKK